MPRSGSRRSSETFPTARDRTALSHSCGRGRPAAGPRPLTPLVERALAWLPVLGIAAMTLVALFMAVALPATRLRKLLWAAVVLVPGAGLAAAIATREHASDLAVARLQAALDQAEADPAAVVDTAIGMLDALGKRVGALEAELAEVKEKAKARTIDADTAAKFSEYVRQFGPHRVVVSCAPGDVEAFNYANQIVNALKGANWDALGPEPTALYGNAPAMGVTLYVHGGRAPEAARILVDAFTKFNIAYQSRVVPSSAIPDAETVELFVGSKP